MAKKIIAQTIRFQDKGFRLSIDALKKQARAKAANHANWRSPALKFVSFHQGVLTLMNTSENRLHTLILQVKENCLLVTCGCGNRQPTICVHAYAALYVIIWQLGEQYFQKLQPDGLMAMAFAHKKYFDKKECLAGLDVSARPEQQSIFFLAPKLEKFDIATILRLPLPAVKKKVVDSEPTREATPNGEESLAYLLIISARNKLLPALMPCTGKLNKKGTEVKTFRQFLSGIEQQSSHLLTSSQRDLNMACYHLWKIVEKQKGNIVNNQPTKNSIQSLTAIFHAWEKIIPMLQRQPFVYSYYLYGVKELKGTPQKRRIRKITLSSDLPELRFILKDMGVFYQLEMQVWVNDNLLLDPDVGTTLFIRDSQKLYMLSSIRDAAIAEWIDRSGGWITIFKEHFNKFGQEILTPLRQHYPIEKTGIRDKNT
jgi:hypothetical protein